MFHRNTGEVVNGIEFTRRNRITLTNKILISPQLKLLQYMLVIAGVYGTLFSLITGLNIPVYKNGLIAAIFLSALYFFILYLFHPIIKISLPLSFLLYLVSGYVFWDEIINGFWHLENIYISKYNSYYNTGILKYLVEEYDQKAVITIFFIFAAILLSLLICAVILRNSLRYLFVIITLFLVLLPFTVGFVPSPLPFGIYLACVISIIGIGTTMKEKHRHFNLKHLHGRHKVEDRLLEQNFKYVIGLKIGGFLAALLLALFLFTSIIITPDLYAAKFNVADTKNKIQKEMMEFNLEEAIQNISSIQLDGLDLFQGITASGGLSGGKLGRIGEVNFNYNTALRIQTTVTGSNLYLKGYVGSVYKGNYWDGLSKQDIKAYGKIAAIWENTDFTIGNQSSYFLSLIDKASVANSYKSFVFFANDMEVENISANSKYIYAPYYTVYAPDEIMNAANPEYVSPKQKQPAYQFSYYDCFNNILEFDEEEEYNDFINKSGISLSYATTNDSSSLAAYLAKMEEYRAFEKSYRKYVYDVYTSMPDAGLERIREYYGGMQYDNYKEKYGTKALSMLVDLVRKDLRSAATYSLSPGALPRGKDFVEYFLYENKTGYCTHFASAATMIFRTMGIPARYVEGYIVKPNDIAVGQTLGTQVLTERINGVNGEHQRIKKSIEITDANAHAWVEIYLDGFGWVPIEVTPGFSRNGIFMEDVNVQPGQTENSENPETPGVTPSPSPTQEAEQETKEEDKPADSKEEEEKASEEEKEASVSKGEDSGTGSLSADEETDKFFGSFFVKLAWVILWGLIIIAGVILFFALRAFVILSKREKAQKTSDLSRRVLLRYNEIKRILDYRSITIQEDLTYQEAADKVEEQWEVISPGSYRRFTDIALKAKFYQYCITRDESEEAEKFYKELIDSVYKNASLSKRLILRFIKVFH